MPSIARVALDTPLSRLFDYRLPDSSRPLPAGTLVEVPFGRSRQVGVVLDCVDDSPVADDKLKALLRVLDDRPPVAPDILKLARFCADYYHHPLGA
ncbi:MAG: primosomal protein N', partial [Thiobacillus sp.]